MKLTGSNHKNSELRKNHLEPYKKDYRNNKERYDKKSCLTIEQLPEEILLMVFWYLNQNLLLDIVPRVCQRWRRVSTDPSLWRQVTSLNIQSPAPDISHVRAIVSVVPALQSFIISARKHGMVHPSGSIPVSPEFVCSLLTNLPFLKFLHLTGVKFQSGTFYNILSKKFHVLEKVNVSCTSLNEVNIFLNSLYSRVSQFVVNMPARQAHTDGKIVFWGRTGGLRFRPMPTSPYFPSQYSPFKYPDYYF